MKTLPAALAAHYAQDALTVATAMRIERADGQVFGFTSHDVSVTIDSVTYDATQGLDVSQIVTSAGLDVDNLEMTTLDDGSLFDRTEVLGGLWNGARFVIFRYNWAQPDQGIDTLLAGIIGEVRLARGQVVCELRGLQQYLQQPLGSVSTRTCRARFADFPQPVPGNLCRLAPASYTVTRAVTAVVSRSVFDTTLTAVDDYYAEGVLTWITGANAGVRAKVAAYTQTGGRVTLMLPLPADVAAGDQFSIIAGCRKRLSDCRDKFNNVLNFQGEPHRPTLDAITAAPD